MKYAEYSIYGNSGYGPTFGGHDIYIQNGGSASSSFPQSYDNGFNSTSQTTYTLLTGNHSGSSFKALEYEVYQLIY